MSKKQLSEVTSAPPVPLMEDVLKDISDGCSLCILISFYCPKQLNFSGQCSFLQTCYIYPLSFQQLYLPLVFPVERVAYILYLD